MGILLKIWLLFPSNIRLLTYRLLARIGHRLYPTTDPFGSMPRCFRLPFGLYAKTGHGVFMAEAEALRFVSQHISIPAPRLIDAIPVTEGAFIVMTALPGHPIADGLMRMSSEQRAQLASDMKECFEKLRSLPPPLSGPRICAADGGPFVCYRIGFDPVGPFATEKDFYHVARIAIARPSYIKANRAISSNSASVARSADQVEDLSQLFELSLL